MSSRLRNASMYVSVVSRRAPGRAAGDRVCGGDQDVLYRLHLDLVVVGADRTHHVVGLPGLFGDAPAYKCVRPLDLVVDRLAHVVQQRGPPRELRVRAEFLAIMPHKFATSTECERTFWP
jgi:hypothetical protein